MDADDKIKLTKEQLPLDEDSKGPRSCRACTRTYSLNAWLNEFCLDCVMRMATLVLKSPPRTEQRERQRRRHCGYCFEAKRLIRGARWCAQCRDKYHRREIGNLLEELRTCADRARRERLQQTLKAFERVR